MWQKNKKPAQSDENEKKPETKGVKEKFYDKIPLSVKQLDIIIIILIILIAAALILGVISR